MNQKTRTSSKGGGRKKERKRREPETLFSKWQRGAINLKQYEDRRKREEQDEKESFRTYLKDK